MTNFEYSKTRVVFIDWACNFDHSFFMAAYSAVNGAWDDIKKDLQRGKITIAQAYQIIDKLFELGFIIEWQSNYRKEQIKNEAR